MRNPIQDYSRARWLGLSILLVSVACRDYLSNPRSESRPLFSQASQPAKIRPEESAFAELARHSPSSAGFYFDRTGQLVVVVRDAADDLSARSSMTDFVAAGRIRGVRTTGTLRIQRGQYTFNELARWRDLILENILGDQKGITSLDLNEEANRVTIGLSLANESGTRALLPLKLAALDIDTNAIAYRRFDPEDVVPDSISRWAIWDVLVGGINVVTERGGCTLGIIADSGSLRGIVTASHCSEQTWSLDSGPIYQPFDTSTYQKGTERTDPSGWACGFLGMWSCRNSDASFYSLGSGISSYRGVIARTTSYANPGSGVGSKVVDSNQPYLFVEGVDNDDLYTGLYVNKMGDSTGWTRGQITGTCVDYTTDWNTTLCTYESDMFVGHGDSGSPVFVFPQNNSVAGDLVTLVGVVKSKYTYLGQFVSSYFSKWTRIVTDLGSLNPTREITLSTPSLSGSMIFTYPSLSWSSVSGATRYDLYRIGNGGTWSFGTQTATTRDDGSSNVLEYVGETEPGGSRVGYYVVAVGTSGVSARSTTVWYRAATGTFSVSISGPSVVGPNSYDCSQWFAYVTGATSPLTYSWTGYFTGSNNYVEGTIPLSGADFQLIVVDSQDRQGGAVKHVSYDANHLDYCQ